MRIKRILSAILVLVICISGFTALAANYDMPYYIEVDITNQIVTIYKTADNSIVRQMLTSSGMNDCTPKGTFYLMEKGRASERGEWTWFQQYHCWVKYATRIYKGYMFHSLPFQKKDESTMIQEMVDEFGLPTSHGCMRLRVDDARFIAKECLVGTRVTIYKSDSKDEELRQLLYVSSYTGEDGMSYQEFLGYSEDALSRGAVGTQVSDLQHRLADLGYYDGEPSGRYDATTIAAVKHVQQDLGLKQNGITSAELQQLLFSNEAPVSAGQTTLELGRSGPVVQKLQSALSTIGLYSGDMLGIYDTNVAQAVGAFQSACGLVADGVASAQLQQMLYYHMDRLEETFGAGSLPAAEVVQEEVTMATLRSDSNILIRAQADTNSAEVGKLTDGDSMYVNSVDGDWVNITFNSVTGFVKKKYLKGSTQNNTVIRFTGDNGASYQIGHTMAEYANGAQTAAEEFIAYYNSEQCSSDQAETVDYVTVNTGSDDVKLNLRAEANSQGAILAEVPNGTSLRALADESGWTRVAYEDQMGYLLNDYLSFWQGSAEEGESAIEDEYSYADTIELGGENESILAVVVCADESGNVGVYESASEDSNRSDKLAAGKQVEVVQINSDGWIQIKYGKKQQGFMREENLQFQLMS